MVDYDLCVAWNWAYDADFIGLLENRCLTKGLSMLQVTPGNLAESLHSLAAEEIGCYTFFDRASDEDPQFLPLVQWAHENRIFGINTYERARHTWDKAEMHAQLVMAGLDVPLTIILPPYVEQPTLPTIDLPSFGDHFTIKPAHGYGGLGVVSNVSSWDQVLAVRQERSGDKYLLQAQVTPLEVNLRPAWFRVIYCAGRVYPCWWHPITHVYTPVTPEEECSYGLLKLEEMVTDISRLCGLDLFSSEIALLQDGQLKVIDYVNDQIDMRLQSHYKDGVPDLIVHEIAGRLVSQLAQLV